MLQNVPGALEEMDRSEAAFNRFCDLNNIPDRASTQHMQALEYEKLSCIQDPVEKLRQSELLAGRLEQMESPKAGLCLSDAADLASLFYKFTSDPDFQQKYFDLQARLETYDEKVSEDITDLVQHRNSLISFTLSTSVDREKSLEWIDGFRRRHSYFESPAILASLYRSQSALFRSLRRMQESSEADRKVAELEVRGPSIGDWIHHRSGPVVLPSHDKDTAMIEEPSDEAVDENFFWPWRNSMRNETGTDTTTIDLLWEWSFDDVAAGHLSVEDFRGMMGITKTDIKFDVSPRNMEDTVKIVGSEQMDQLASIIYPRTLEVTELQEAKYERICKWLSSPPKGLREKRLFCLMMLRDSRQAYFSDQNMLDLRIRELQTLLELERTLPKIIREAFPRNRSSWVGGMCMTLVTQLGPVADFTSDETSKRLLEAEKWNEDALEEHLRVNDRVSYARFLRTGAQICLMKIFRLQQLMESPDKSKANSTTAFTEDEIKALQAKGTKRVEEADAILSRHEINSSWSDGLDSVHHRQDLTRFYGSAFTAITATTLYLAQKDELSPDAAGSVWSWVQKYKARSLARTIGVRSYDPPELINRIVETPETRALYEQMLDLKKRTEEADLMARFELRRQMDAHLERMKSSHPLLRQLVDLREATPFATSDIANLEAQAGSPVVLVDWFYLPPYITDQAGRMLLFTARADKAPIMDVLPVTEADVLSWQQQYLSPSTWRRFREENLDTPEARSKFDAQLGGLVAPLAYRTKRGEVLVLCPSSTLHRVPLHALSLTYAKDSSGSSTTTRTEALIHRNPIIYTHSHSLLRSCATAAEYARHAPRELQALFLSGIPAAEAAGYAAGRQSIRDLAGGFGVPSLMDAGAGKAKFLEGAAGSRLIHLHTHCNWRAGDPLNHHVEFPRVVSETTTADEKGQPPPELGSSEDGTKSDSERPVDRLTARELFEIRLPPSTHVNMVACQGAWPTCSWATR
ncbi:CHAT domain-containing protein [Apiospora aurea]|uniref:CHAT domain-containing protein n=1 Tax=Apiospora aurea TaxID=335848 RepID=A0ABR1QPD5_9PEZI